MSRCTLRYLVTILLYAGVAFVLIPYVIGQTTRALLYLLVGIGIALVCGFARCYLMDGDCDERIPDLPYTSDNALPRGK